MRSFKLYRRRDLSGTSGTGYVAIGYVSPTGCACVRWVVDARLADGSTRKIKTITKFENWIDVVLLHGHGGRTVLIWDDTGEIVSDLDFLNATTKVA
jgi:hypothetical protein